MKPETRRYLAKARRCLDHARANFQIGIGDDAGRNAYLAGFHAAQALIFARTGKSAKTHRGVHSQFERLAKNEPAIDGVLRQFLGRAYNLKAVADYETGPGSEVPLDPLPPQLKPRKISSIALQACSCRRRIDLCSSVGADDFVCE